MAIGVSQLFSCASAKKYAYTPSTANLLQLHKKGDFKAAVNYSTAAAPATGQGRKTSAGIDLQTAYALGKKIVVKADAFSKAELNQSTGTSNGIPFEKIRYKKQGVEIGMGCHNFSKDKDRTAFQLFAGAGTGRFSFYSQYNNGAPDNHHSMQYFKAFIQPSYTFIGTKNYDLTFAGKVNMLQFNRVVTDYPDLSSEPLGYIDTKPNFFIDLIMQHQFGFTQIKGLQFQLQFGLSKLATRFSAPQPNLIREKYDYNDTWFAAGFILDAGKLGKRK